MQTFILRESVLNDDTLYLADSNKVFEGGYIAMIKEYTYATPWTNKETIKRFKKIETLNKYLAKNYSDFQF